MAAEALLMSLTKVPHMTKFFISYKLSGTFVAVCNEAMPLLWNLNAKLNQYKLFAFAEFIVPVMCLW